MGIGPSVCTPQPITLYDGGGGPSRVQGYRYPHQSLEIVTHGGKRTAHVLCRPRAKKAIQNNTLVNRSPTVNMNDCSSYFTDGTDRAYTVSVVSNLSELSELSTLQGIDEDLMTLKRRSDLILPELHGPKKEIIHRRKSTVKKPNGAFEILTHQRDIAIKEKNQLTEEMSKLSSQNQMITNLKQNEIFLLREKSNLESELKGLHQNMKRILEANILLRNEISNLNSEKNSYMSQQDSREENELKVKQLKDVIEILKEENLVYAKQIDTKNVELKEIDVIMSNSELDASNTLQFEKDKRKNDDQIQLITSLKQSLAAYKIDLEATKSSKISSEEDTKIARQELESVTKARDWYQKQMKDSQQLRANSIKDAMLLNEENISLKSSNNNMCLTVKSLESEIERQKSALLKEKESLVAKLELLDEDLENRNIIQEQTLSKKPNDKIMKKVVNNFCQTDEIVIENDFLEKQKKGLEKDNCQLKEELLENVTKMNIMESSLNQALIAEAQQIEELNICKEEYHQRETICQNLDTELKCLKNSQISQDEKIRCTKLDLGKSISMNNKLKREVSEYKDTIENLRSSQVNSEEISKNYASISQDMHNIKEENTNLKVKLSTTIQMDIEVSNKNEEIEKLNKDIKATIAQKNDLIVERENFGISFKSLTNEKESLLEEKVELLSLNTKLSEFVENLEAQNANYLTNNEDLEKNMEIQNQDLNKKSKEIDKINSEKKKFEKENSRLLKQFNDEKDDLENVIKELENVKENLMKDKSKGVTSERELFEELQNADRENKEKIKILDSNLKNAENRIKEQINLKEVCLRELEEVQEAKHEQGNVVTLLEEKIKRIEREVKNLSTENDMKDENLNTLKIDLLELEKDRGTLSAVLFENKALQENCALLEKNLQTLNECQGKVSVLEHNLLKCKETIHEQEDHISIVSKEKVQLKEESANLRSKLLDKNKELIEKMDANRHLIENLKRDMDSQISENQELNTQVESLTSNNLDLQTKNAKTNGSVTELKHRIIIKDQKEIILDEQLNTINMSLQERNEEIRIKKQEIEQTQNIHKLEIDHLKIQLSRFEKNFNERESTIHSLRTEKQTHQKQLKQMQLAL